MRAPGVQLWPLPALIAASLIAAAHLALWLSIRDGHVPACVPYLEGCTSISRAARHGLGNHLFRLLVLPTALLVALHWWAAAAWLRLHGRNATALVAVGVLAGVSLAVYATFLGTEGHAYRFLRRYGVIVFFGASYVAQLLFLHGAERAGAPIERGLRRALRGICVAMLSIGLLHIAALAAIGGSALQDSLENALEWWLGAGLVTWYALMAALWRRHAYRLDVQSGG